MQAMRKTSDRPRLSLPARAPAVKLTVVPKVAARVLPYSMAEIRDADAKLRRERLDRADMIGSESVVKLVSGELIDARHFQESLLPALLDEEVLAVRVIAVRQMALVSARLRSLTDLERRTHEAARMTRAVDYCRCKKLLCERIMRDRGHPGFVN